MALNSAFAPLGETVCIAVTDVASSPYQVKGATGGQINYKITTDNFSDLVFVAWAPPTSDGNAPSLTPAIATNGSPANAFPITGAEDKVFSFPANSWFAAITGSGVTANLYITPGEGL